ncbi:hypothetical protein AB0F43_30860 [Kribbella sp. NPDC023972]|uniref:hypothetical protein n=1 Tax=Kribbella sp. NPDC023972 TaxID=3154795 RepID=UPI0033F66503
MIKRLTNSMEDSVYTVFEEPTFRLRLLLEEGEPLDQVCNVDGWMTYQDGFVGGNLLFAG